MSESENEAKFWNLHLKKITKKIDKIRNIET